MNPLCPANHTFYNGMCRDAAGRPANPKLYTDWSNAQKRVRMMR